MGRTSKPLRFLVSDKLRRLAEVEKLFAQGHTIVSASEWTGPELMPFEDFDLIIGDNCHWFTEDHVKYFDEAIKTARKRRYSGE